MIDWKRIDYSNKDSGEAPFDGREYLLSLNGREIQAYWHNGVWNMRCIFISPSVVTHYSVINLPNKEDGI